MTAPATLPPPPPAPPPPTDHRSWTIAAAVLLVLRLASTILQAIGRGGISTEFSSGYVVGAVVADLAMVGIPYGLAYLIAKPPRRRRTAAITAFVVLALLLVSDCAGKLSRLNVSGARLTDADRAALEVTPTGIRHPIGFSAPHPGEGFVDDTTATRAANEQFAAAGMDTAMTAWAFRREEPFGVAVVQLTVTPSDVEATFRGVASGMRKRLRDPAVGQVLVDTLLWTAEQREFRLAIQYTETGTFISWRCLPSTAAHARAFMACAMRSAMDTTGIGAFTEGLKVDAPPR